MRRTEYFLPTLKEDPKEAEIVSHKLMLRTGMIRQEAAGIYSWLPLGLKVLYKIEQIVREEQNRSGAFEIMMPTIQPAFLWKKSGRYEAYGKEMLRITDRHDREMLYSPTNEEMLTDIFATYVNSYKDLPKNLYQIHWKFRDEVRPRFGVMRGREFFMKDNYSFDLDEESARISYMKMFYAYMRTFNRMGVNAIPMKADTGPIGGDLSHEFILLAKTGESGVFVDRQWLDVKNDAVEDIDPKNIDDITKFFDKFSSIYAATDEIHDPKDCPDDLTESRGVEVGHIFYFGTKYSETMGAKVTTKDGSSQHVHMGSYGIGVSRLVGALIEASHDENGIIWPEEVAPFDVGLINLKVGDEGCDKVCEDLYAQLQNIGKDVLYDERDVGAGFKFNDMDLIGLPWQVTIGPRGLKSGMAEVKNRATGKKTEVSLDKIISFFENKE